VDNNKQYAALKEVTGMVQQESILSIFFPLFHVVFFHAAVTSVIAASLSGGLCISYNLTVCRTNPQRTVAKACSVMVG
jgi:hypothetical protein